MPMQPSRSDVGMEADVTSMPQPSPRTASPDVGMEADVTSGLPPEANDIPDEDAAGAAGVDNLDDGDVQHSGDNEDDISVELFQQHLDSLEEDQKKFVADMTTPETVAWLGLVTGSRRLAETMSKFMDESKAIVPMPRQVAQQLQAQLQNPQQQV